MSWDAFGRHPCRDRGVVADDRDGAMVAVDPHPHLREGMTRPQPFGFTTGSIGPFTTGRLGAFTTTPGGAGRAGGHAR